MKILGFNISRAKPAEPAAAKSLDALAWLRGDSDSGSGGAVLYNAYQQVVWVYTAINVLAQQVANIPFVFSHGDRTGKDIIASGPLVDFYEQPHEHIDGYRYWELRIIWLMLRGECFRVPIYSDQNKRKLQGILILDPANFQEILQDGALLGWRYNGGSMRSPLASTVLLPEEVWYERLPNPFDFWRGMSPLSVARLTTQTDFAAAAFMKGLMENNADTGVVVQTEQQLDAEQREQMMGALRERKRKAGTADRPLLLWGGAEVMKPTISSVDMQFLENRRWSRAEICSVFGVPEEIVGSTDTAKYDVMNGARLNFIENRVMPLCRRLEASERRAVESIDPTAQGWFDVDSLPIMQEARRQRWTTAKAGFDMGVPFNELNKVFALGAQDLPWGDKGFLPFSVQPVEAILAPPEPAPAAQPPPAQQNALERAMQILQTPSSEPAKPQKEPHVCAPNPEHERAIAGSVKAKKGRLEKFFYEQSLRVLARLPDVMKEFTRREWSQDVGETTAISWTWEKAGVTSRGVDDLFNHADEDARLQKALKPLLISDLEAGGSKLFSEINAGAFNLSPKDAIDFLDKRKNVISGINSTTWDKVKGALQEGLQAGETMEDLISRIKASFATTRGRAEVIALTETNVANNSGRNLAMKVANVPRKGWLTSHLENTRTSHLENEQLSETENGIPLDEPWPNGCMFPGDPEAEASETVNCRCVGIAILDEP